MMRMNPVIIKREKNSKNYSTSRGAQSRLDSSTHHDRTMDRNSIFDLHARDSMDSMRISQQKQVDFTSRKQSAGVKQRNENESNTLMQASRNDSNKYAYKADNSIVKFQSPFKNQTPKTAHSQLGQNRSRLRDNVSNIYQLFNHIFGKLSFQIFEVYYKTKKNSIFCDVSYEELTLFKFAKELALRFINFLAYSILTYTPHTSIFFPHYCSNFIKKYS